MRVSLTRNDPTGIESDFVELDDVVAYDTFGADDEGPVFLFILSNGSRVKYHKSEWTAFALEWHELQ